MRRLPILILLSALALAFGCSDSSDVVSDVAGPNDLSSDAYAVVGAEDVFANIEDATMTHDMAMRPVPMDPGAFRRHPGHPGHPGSHLGFVLRLLGIDEDQAQAIRAMVQEHRAEVRMILEQLRMANQDLIDRANQERARIVEAARNQEIGLEEALRRLHELNQRTREAIRQNPENARYFEALCSAKRGLFDDIGSVLNDRQRAAWDDWVAGLDGPCLGD
jgi:Spy/CpxP family protein refolding chaperone